jgi:predicted nuclease of predicted toxin-antitoxin system
MRFLVDAQLPQALARRLAAEGHDAEHVADLGLGAAQDTAVWDYALRTGAIIVSKDEDFAQRRILKDDGPSVVWSDCGTHPSVNYWFGSKACCQKFCAPWSVAKH